MEATKDRSKTYGNVRNGVGVTDGVGKRRGQLRGNNCVAAGSRRAW